MYTEKMITPYLRHLKYYYIDTADPERMIAKSAFRTAFACMICIVLFQITSNNFITGWAGFAAFTFVQNDIQAPLVKRLYFLTGVIFTFTFLAFLGTLLSNNLTILLVTLPIIIFICAYLACLGFNYFSASAWALFVYILSTTTPLSFHQALHFSSILLVCGGLSILCCFFIFPLQPYKKLLQSYRRILLKSLLLLQSDPHKNKRDRTTFNTQLDQLLAIQENNLSTYLQSDSPTATRKKMLDQLTKILYQISLMTKSTVSFQQKIIVHPNYQETPLNACNNLIAKLFKTISFQFNRKNLSQIEPIRKELMTYRDTLIDIRKAELLKSDPDFSSLLDYSTYFYHLEKLLELLELASKTITLLRE